MGCVGPARDSGFDGPRVSAPGTGGLFSGSQSLAATSEPKVVTLYDLDSGRESVLWRAPDQGAWDVRDLAFSQDGSNLVIYAGINYDRRDGDQVWVVNV